MSPFRLCRGAALLAVVAAGSIGSTAWAAESTRASEPRDGCSCACKVDDDATPATCGKPGTDSRVDGDRKGGAPAAVSRRPRWHRYLPGMIR
ncbi:MAG: hypothetical protein DI635_07015 [Pseudoxanthomonas suwonensis]|nr:MAG: hypothetical protein DI635_07015 [Pseudoxanthomonas suwonensis]